MYIEHGLRGSRLTSAGTAGDDIDLVSEGTSDSFLLTVGQGDAVLILVLLDEIINIRDFMGMGRHQALDILDDTSLLVVRPLSVDHPGRHLDSLLFISEIQCLAAFFLVDRVWELVIEQGYHLLDEVILRKTHMASALSPLKEKGQRGNDANNAVRFEIRHLPGQFIDRLKPEATDFHKLIGVVLQDIHDVPFTLGAVVNHPV